LKNDSTQKKVEEAIDQLSRIKRKDRSALEKVRLLQLKLYQKAKQQPTYKFYILYDKVFLVHILEQAYLRCKAKAGSPGVDKVSFTQIEQTGREAFLEQIREELRTRSYKPSPVKRVWIEKENGGERPLGIPTIKDRVVQQACKMVIEPIFEADFEDCSHGFRPNRSAKDAITQVKEKLTEGMHEVYDADLSKYFDTIPHEQLMVTLGQRIADPRVLWLIKQWLKTPVIEPDGTYSGGKRQTKGTPQGGVISPLLANIYMNLIDKIVGDPKGYYAEAGIRMIRYADDFILMGRHIEQEAILRLHHYLQRMGLTINAEKSKQVDARRESFDFLGFTIRYDRSIFDKKGRFWNIIPKASSQKKIRQKIANKLKAMGHYPPEQVVRELNPILRGWINYYQIPGVSYTQVATKGLNDYLRRSIERYFRRKSQRKSRLHGDQAYKLLTRKYGLVAVYVSSGTLPAKAQRRKQ
jgi:RNA-directed DNA polymerase